MPQHLAIYKATLSDILLVQSLQPLATVCFRMGYHSAGLACLTLSGIFYFRHHPVPDRAQPSASLGMVEAEKDRLFQCSLLHKVGVIMRESCLIMVRNGPIKTSLSITFLVNHQTLNSLKGALNPVTLFNEPQSEQQRRELHQAKQGYRDFSILALIALFIDVCISGSIEYYKSNANKPSPSF